MRQQASESQSSSTISVKLNRAQHENNLSSFGTFGRSTQSGFNVDEPLRAGLTELAGREPDLACEPDFADPCRMWSNSASMPSSVRSLDHSGATCTSSHNLDSFSTSSQWQSSCCNLSGQSLTRCLSVPSPLWQRLCSSDGVKQR